MARILLGWELGGGHGHAVNLVALGRALQAHGHEPVIVARDVTGTWPVLRDSGVPVWQAPAFGGVRSISEAGRGFRARSFADVLALFGYGDDDVLEPQVRSWEATVDLLRPDLVVSEFAPTLCLATCGQVPRVAFGIGYCVPCLHAGVFPVLDARATEVFPAARLQDVLAGVLARRGRAVPANPFEAVLGDVQLNVGMDELDPYRDARERPALGPLATLPPLAPPPSSPWCVAYLPAEHPRLDDIIAALAGLPMPGVAYVRGASARQLEALQRTPLAVSTQPLDLGVELARATVVLHHGGPGTVQRCLAAGVPQIASPVHLEQLLVAQALERLGVGESLVGDEAVRQCAMRLAALSADAGRQASARALAGAVQARYPSGSLERVVAECTGRTG